MLKSWTLLRKPRSVKGNFGEAKSHLGQEERCAETTKNRKLREELKTLKEKLHSFLPEQAKIEWLKIPNK